MQSKTVPTIICLTHVCPRVPVHGVKWSAQSAVGWNVHLSSCTHWFYVALAPVQHCNAARAIIGYCDHGMRANLSGVSVAYDGIRKGHFGTWTDCLPDQHTFAPYSDMSRFM